MTLKALYSGIASHLPDLLRLRNGTLLPGELPPLLARLELADEHGLTKKGEKALGHLLKLADLLDIPYA